MTALNVDPMEGSAENVAPALERINTYGLLSGTKVVALTEATFLESRPDSAKLLVKARQASEEGDWQKGARHFMTLVAMLELGWEDLDEGSRRQALKIEHSDAGEEAWLGQMIAYCRSQNLAPVKGADGLALLLGAIEKGFPKGHHLVITADTVDRRQRLFKLIDECGVVVDCTVPKGERRADRMVQAQVLKEQARGLLQASGKRLEPDAYQKLVEMTGFDLRTFSQNLEKLIAYTGKQTAITTADVDALLERTKKDPIFELTGALAERHLENALFYLNSLLADGFHPLQVLAAMINQVRRLLLIKGFTLNEAGRSWHPNCLYDAFQARVMPGIEKWDRSLMAELEKWEAAVATGPAPKKGARKPVTDLLIAKNPKNAYPVYHLFTRAEHFTMAELTQAMADLKDADVRLKSSGQPAAIVLEQAIMGICRSATGAPKG
jgi:DNA polymerase-3 subunit delta